MGVKGEFKFKRLQLKKARCGGARGGVYVFPFLVIFVSHQCSMWSVYGHKVVLHESVAQWQNMGPLDAISDRKLLTFLL